MRKTLFICAIPLVVSCSGMVSSTKNVLLNVPEKAVVGDTVKELGSSIMVIYQDQKNMYWFGSWETGIYRYDGETLINYTTQHGLPNNRIDEIKEDKFGNLYFGSCSPTSNIVKFDGKIFSQLKPVPSKAWKLQSDDLWFRHAYQKEKVYRYDGATLHELIFPKPSSIPNPFEIYCIYQDQKKNIWFGTNPSGVCRYNGKSFDWIIEEDVTEFRDEGANGVRSICEDKNGDFWFNTEQRYSIYDQAKINSPNFYKRHSNIGSLDGKKDGNLDEYLSCLKDDQNNLWFVTYRKGVWKYDGISITHYPIQYNLQNITSFSIYKDHRGTLWLGTHDNGAYQFNGKEFVKFTP